MSTRPSCWLAAALAAAACQSYAPAPVDLAAHAREFAVRLPDAESVRAFVQHLHALRLPGARPAGEADRSADRSADPSADRPADRPANKAPDKAAAPVAAPAAADDGIDLGTARQIALWFNADLRHRRAQAGITAASLQHSGHWRDPELGLDLERILADAAHPWLAAASLGLSIPLTGRPGLERQLAAGENARELLLVRIAEVRVLDELDAAWTRWSALRLRADLLRELLAQIRDLEAIAARLAEAHEITAAAARTFALERLARAAELLRTEAEVAIAAAERNELLGLPPDRELPFVPRLQVDARAPDRAQRSTLPADSPLLAVRRSEHDTAERALELAIAEQWPDFTLLPGFANEDAEPRATVGFRIPLPMWNGNARAIAAARAVRAAAAAALCSEHERAVHQLARAEIRLDGAMRQRALVETELVPLCAQQLAEERRLAELGQLEPLRILDALTRAHAAKAAAVDAALDEARATVALNSLFWPPDPAATPESHR